MRTRILILPNHRHQRVPRRRRVRAALLQLKVGRGSTGPKLVTTEKGLNPSYLFRSLRV